MKARYLIYLCSQCGEQSQFAGFCDSCNSRLGAYSCVPVERILEMRDAFVEASSPVPAEFIRLFVDSLLSPTVSSVSEVG